MLKATHLTLQYSDRKQPALEDLSFMALSGEVIGLLGYSAAGKTSLLRIITGELQPTGGFLSTRLPPGSAAYLSCASSRGSIDPQASLENLLVDPPASSMTSDLIQGLALDRWSSQTIAALPEGLAQRAWLACALLRPAVLLALDTLPGLDEVNMPFLHSWLRERARTTGQIIFISTRKPEVAGGLCGRILVLNSGRLVLDETLQRETAASQAKIFQVRVSGALDPRRASWFDGLEVSPLGEETILTGELPDQAALYGLLLRLRDLGLTLLSMRSAGSALETRLAKAMGSPV